MSKVVTNGNIILDSDLNARTNTMNALDNEDTHSPVNYINGYVQAAVKIWTHAVDSPGKQAVPALH